MILIRSLRLEAGEDISALLPRAAKALGCPAREIGELKLVKRSLDARKKNDIHYVCSVAVSLPGEEKYLERNKALSLYHSPELELPQVEPDSSPVVVGFGPAGMFAALALARAGARPIVLERGEPVEQRQKDVDSFRRGGPLNTESNVQFGEGGAGTFSDGKLNTGTHDPRMSWVLREFYRHGAPESVTYDAKPHVGTDILVDVVRNIRREILELGGEIRFGSRLEKLLVQEGRLSGIEYSCGGKTESLVCSRLILAIGHSARDSFEKLLAQGIHMEQKPFSMGVRIEHLQKDIDRAQYGRERGKLPPAVYNLSVHLPDGSSAYTFCMCPGGKVFAAASEEGGVVTNGMSYSKRDGENANAALLVTLRPEDFPSEHILAGMYWQRELERLAYEYTGSYRAPAQLAGDFLAGRPSSGPGKVKPSYEPGVYWGDLRRVLPEKICSVLAAALPELGKKLRGFDDFDAVLTAPETRSSSPVRIVRGEDLQGSVKGLYPCGEGAGYAGGITSAAVDGLRCAQAILQNMAKKLKTAFSVLPRPEFCARIESTILFGGLHMELLERRILSDGKVLPGGILKVDGFLNHQIDPALLYEMALELKRLYAGEEINKVLTIEASGIAIAALVGYVFGCPLVFAKKSKSKNISPNVYSVEVESFTHGNTNTVVVSKEYLGKGDRVLIIDDFLATGAALVGLKELVEQAGATLVGAGIAIEKVFQGGGELLRSQGMRVESLARIASMSDDSLTFC